MKLGSALDFKFVACCSMPVAGCQPVRDFYSRWGQLAHLTKLQFFIRKRKRQNSNIDKQNHHQKTVEKFDSNLTAFGYQ